MFRYVYYIITSNNIQQSSIVGRFVAWEQQARFTGQVCSGLYQLSLLSTPDVSQHILTQLTEHIPVVKWHIPVCLYIVTHNPEMKVR